MIDGKTYEPATLAEIKALPNVKMTADFEDGRYFAMIPVQTIKTGRPFTSNRGKDPKDVDHLRTTARSSNLNNKDGFINSPVVFFRRDLVTGDVAPWMVEGHQRFRVILQSKVEFVIVCFLLWKNDAEAFEAGAAMNWGRHSVGTETLFSMLVEGQLMQKQIADVTGTSETQISRMAKMAGYQFLVDLVTMGVITYTTGAKMIGACSSVIDGQEKEQNIQKNLDQLESTITYHRQRAKKKAMDAQAKINKNPDKKWGKYKLQAKEEYHLKKDVDWKKLVQAIEDINTRSSTSGTIFDINDLKNSADPVTFGDEEDWKTRVAFDRLQGREFSKMDTDDLETVLKNWQWAGQMIQAAYDEKIRVEERKKTVYPQRTSTQTDHEPEDLDSQDPEGMEMDEDE